MPNPEIFKKTVRNLRRAFHYQSFSEKDLVDDPFVLFENWFQQAVKTEKFEPNAMSLATVNSEGKPRVRTVLLKDFGPEGFVFFTDYHSRKGQDLTANPAVSLVFYWPGLVRQVLIEGDVEKVSREESVEYFHSRPRPSQLAAAASDQSSPVASREELEQKMRQISVQNPDGNIPCPEDWGGFRIKPSRIEFWQGSPDRLHDRFAFTLNSEGRWDVQRLAP